MRSTKVARVFTVLAALAAANAVLAQEPSRFVVALDAAHGGDDPGARLADGQPEKAINLALSVRLRSLLGARGVPAATTREQDVAVDAAHRADAANRWSPRACLILHATESGSGVHLFVTSLPPTPSGNAGQPAGHRPAQSAWTTQSTALAGALNSALQHAGFNVTLGRAPLAALDNLACPAVAVEVAPERGSDHRITTTLDNAGYQSRVAEALAAALLEWRSEGGRP
jgi:N-acetylmuramoyl-L-alanine amidase